MRHAVALLAVLPAGTFFCFAEKTDFELEFHETFMPFAWERAVGDGGEHGAILLLRMRAVTEVAARCEDFNIKPSREEREGCEVPAESPFSPS